MQSICSSQGQIPIDIKIQICYSKNNISFIKDIQCVEENFSFT